MVAIPGMIILVRVVFHKNNKYYPQSFLDESQYKLSIIWKCYILIELMLLKAIMLIKQTNEENGDIYYYWYFLNKGFKFQQYVRNRCHDLLAMSMNLSNIAKYGYWFNWREWNIRNIKSKFDAMNLLEILI